MKIENLESVLHSRGKGLTIIEKNFFEGPNIYSVLPTVEIVLSKDGLSSIIDPIVLERLTLVLKYTREQIVNEDVPIEINNSGNNSTIEKIFAEYVLSLQNTVPINVGFYDIPEIEEDMIKISVEYRYKSVLSEALSGSVELINTVLSGKVIEEELFKKIDEIIGDIKKAYEEKKLGPSTQAIIDAAKERDIPYSRLSDKFSIFSLGWGKNKKMIWGPVTSKTPLIGSDLASEKDLCKQILHENGFSVPRGEVCQSIEGALEIADRIGYPVVLKPVDGHHGEGVIVDLKDEEEVKKAFKITKGYASSILVERFIEGNDYRFLVIGNKVVGVAKRIPPHVVGDGSSTIKELVELKNQDPNRGTGHRSLLTKIDLGEEELMWLTRHGLNIDYIPKEEETVYLRGIANLSIGGTSENYTERVHPSIKRAIERVSKIIGMDVMGVDVIAEDISVPITQSKWLIIEVNASPGLRMHISPLEGDPIPVGKYVIDNLYPEGNGRVPLIAVTGTNGKTTTTRLIEWIARKNGYNTGMAVTGGIWLKDEQISEGDTTGPWSANVVLQNPEVHFAVLETARGGILRSGLAFDKCSVSVLTNVRADHLGVDGVEDEEELYNIKSVLLKATDQNGYCIVNGNDRFTNRALDDSRGTPIMFSVKRNPIVDRFIQEGGNVFLYENGYIWHFVNKKCKPIVNVSDIPFLMGGVEMLVENSLAALAACYSSGISIEKSVEALSSFEINEKTNPGRLNLIWVEEVPVILDYAHNPDCLRALGEFSTHLEVNNKIIVFAGVGDRRDEDLKECAIELTKWFDNIILTENQQILRGREIGEMTSLMKESIEDFEDVIIMNDMNEAIISAIKMSTSEDIVFLADLDITSEDLKSIVGEIEDEKSIDLILREESKETLETIFTGT